MQGFLIKKELHSRIAHHEAGILRHTAKRDLYKQELFDLEEDERPWWAGRKFVSSIYALWVIGLFLIGGLGLVRVGVQKCVEDVCTREAAQTGLILFILFSLVFISGVTFFVIVEYCVKKEKK
jgi:hypothetical protein